MAKVSRMARVKPPPILFVGIIITVQCSINDSFGPLFQLQYLLLCALMLLSILVVLLAESFAERMLLYESAECFEHSPSAHDEAFYSTRGV